MLKYDSSELSVRNFDITAGISRIHSLCGPMADPEFCMALLIEFWIRHCTELSCSSLVLLAVDFEAKHMLGMDSHKLASQPRFLWARYQSIQTTGPATSLNVYHNLKNEVSWVHDSSASVHITRRQVDDRTADDVETRVYDKWEPGETKWYRWGWQNPTYQVYTPSSASAATQPCVRYWLTNCQRSCLRAWLKAHCCNLFFWMSHAHRFILK